MHIKKLQQLLITSFSERGLETTTSIAKETGLVQSTVYRALYGQPLKVTKSLKTLCVYAQIDSNIIKPNPTENEVIISSIREVWDGSDEHAKRIARLLILANSFNI